MRRPTLLTGFLVGLVLAAQPALASTWNTFAKAYNDDALFFFDADTVVKERDSVTLWVKYVNTRSPDQDGSWSTAQRYQIVCSKRTAQVLSSSIYDKENKFIRAYPNPGRVTDIAPDSILEGIHKAVCAPDFPKNKSSDLFFAVRNNDIYEHTRLFLEYLASQQDSAPK